MGERERVSEICSQITRDPLMVNARVCAVALVIQSNLARIHFPNIFIIIFARRINIFSMDLREIGCQR